MSSEIVFHPESESYFIGNLTEYSDPSLLSVSAENVPRGSKVRLAQGSAESLPDMDFETYSEAGFLWNEKTQKYFAPRGATKKGLNAVGAAKYAEDPSTEVLSLSYNLKDSRGPQLWVPHAPLPTDLFDYIASGGLLEAWYDAFEYWIWLRVAHERMGWPQLPFWHLRDAAAKSRAFSLPGKLEKAGEVLNLDIQKDKDGTRLLNKFSMPRTPTKNNPFRRITPNDDPFDAANLYLYNLQDIRSENEVSIRCPDLTGVDLDFYLCTRAMNVRGVAIDMETVNAGVDILDQALEKYDTELKQLTQGVVSKASELAKLIGWVGAKGLVTNSLDQDHIDRFLERDDLLPEVRRALEIRQLVGSAGVKKYYALQRQVTRDGRAHDLFIFNGARTGRDAGADIQPQNLVKAGPKLHKCKKCGFYMGTHIVRCRVCDNDVEAMDWTYEAVDQVCRQIQKRDLGLLEQIYGDAVLTLSGVIRGLFTAEHGKDLICSDYSSIEAVVAAALAGEEWRLRAFENREDIYLVSASRITGTPYLDYISYYESQGSKHPDRQKIGKPAELGLGFGGWINGWRQFDSTDTFTDDQVKENILTWRAASPWIVEMWGGQVRGKPWAPDYKELYGLEGMAIAAILEPGKMFTYRSISYFVQDDILYCKLPSGRLLTYHRPRLNPGSRWEGLLEITYEGWNSNPNNGPFGWIRMQTYSGRLFENVVQAVANDILRFATNNLERAGYQIVLRVHDELVAEVPENWGSVEEVERIMGILPQWAQGWPVRAAGGWRGKRYRKD